MLANQDIQSAVFYSITSFEKNMNKLEKLVKTELEYMVKNDTILWYHKLEQAFRGLLESGQFLRSAAPLDFLYVNNCGRTHYIECKEVGSTSFSTSLIKDEQKRLLTILPSILIVRFYDNKHRSNERGIS